MSGQKTNLGKFKKIVSSIFSSHNSMRLEINYENKTAKSTNTWKLNKMLLNNQWVTEEIKEKMKKYLEKIKITKTRTQRSKIYGTQQNQF